MTAEIHAAASSLITAAAAAQNGDVAAAEIGIEDALFRAESMLSRVRQLQAAGDEGLQAPFTRTAPEE